MESLENGSESLAIATMYRVSKIGISNSRTDVIPFIGSNASSVSLRSSSVEPRLGPAGRTQSGRELPFAGCEPQPGIVFSFSVHFFPR